jgi:hypothetical protein
MLIPVGVAEPEPRGEKVQLCPCALQRQKYTFSRVTYIQLKSEVYKDLSQIHLNSVFIIPDI